MTASADSLSTTAPSDTELIAAVRGGSPDAYGQLYERHHAAAVGLARRYARNSSDAEDLAAEGFANVLAALHGGSGPEEFFRAYLFTCISRLAARGNLKANRENPSDEMERYEGEQPYDDPVLAGFETDAVARAFRTLPERWQAVLWYTEVDGLQPAAIAPLLGLSPNAVSALALRAREGLRQAYLQAHVASEAIEKDCVAYADKLGAYARNGLSQRKAEKVREHVDQCARCSAALLQLEDVGFAMRVVIFPLVTALPFAVPAAGKVAGAGLLAGGGDWVRRRLEKVDRRYAVVGGLVLAVGLAGGVAFASLDTRTTTLPPAQAAAPSVSDGLGSGGVPLGVPLGASAVSGSAKASPSADAPSHGAASAPAAAPLPAAPTPAMPGGPGPLVPAVPGAPSVAVPQPVPPATTTGPVAPPSNAPQAAASAPGSAPASSPSSTNPLYSLTASRPAGSPTGTVQFKATPAPAQGIQIVATVNYKSTVLAPTASSGWSCNAPLVALGDTSITCTAAVSAGAQIPPLSLTWAATAPESISGTAALQQGTVPVSNVAAF